ncbi:MAG TPA: V-type ATP synthase subunit F, partial [Candidatus Poseidoniales archaeon]
SNLYNPDGEEELHSTLRSLLNNKSVGIMVVDSAVMATVSDRLRDQLSASVSPTVLGIGTEEDTTLRDTIRKAIGVDLWK